MKKCALTAVLILVGAQVASATDFTVRPYLGYGFGTNQQNAGSDKIRDTLAAIQVTKDEAINYSAGAGMKLGLGVDIGLNDYLSVEPMLGYAMGAEKETNVYAQSGTGYTSGNTTKKSTSFIPFSVTMKIRGKEGAFTPYAGFGPTFAFGAKATKKYAETGTGSAATGLDASEEETTYDTGIGFHGVVGTDYKVSDSLVIFGQIRADQLSLRQAKGKLTKFTTDGVDQLGGMTVKDKETIYKDNIGGYNSAVTTAPNQQKVTPVSASSVAINFGVAYKF